MEFENPQAVYKWISGRSLPSIDNFLILSKILYTSIEDILVIDGDIVVLIIYKMVLLFMGLTSCEENVNMKIKNIIKEHTNWQWTILSIILFAECI